MKRSWRNAIAVLGALAVLGTMLVMVPALAEHFPPGDPNPDVGVLQLHMSDVNQWIYQAHDSAPNSTSYGNPVVQAITANRCAYQAPTTPSLVDLKASATGKQVGLLDHELGIKSAGSSCGSVESGEGALVIELAGDLADLEIDHFEIDIELKQSVIVRAEMYLAGTLVDTQDLTCPATGDCGNDSNGDNERWTYTPVKPFDRIELSVVSANNGNFSLAGGLENGVRGPLGQALSDQLDVNVDDTLFHITDITTIDCGQTVTEGDGSTEPGSSITRGDDTDSTETDPQCDPKAARHEVSQTEAVQSVSFTELGFTCPSNLSELDGQFTEEIDWLPFPEANPQSPSRSLTYSDLCVNGGAATVVPACVGSPLPLGPDSRDVLPAGHTHCIYHSQWSVVGTSGGVALVAFQDSIYWLGDATKFR